MFTFSLITVEIYINNAFELLLRGPESMTEDCYYTKSKMSLRVTLTSQSS